MIIRTASDLSVLDAHHIAEEVEHDLLHSTKSLEAVVVHVHPVVPHEQEACLHALSAHHANPAAKAAYRERLAAQAGAADPTSRPARPQERAGSVDIRLP